VSPDEVLQAFRETGALLQGHFELRSGLHSDQYFQCAQLLQFPRVSERLCRALVERIHSELGRDFRPRGVIAPAMGGILVGYEVARILDSLSFFAEKEEGKLVLRRGFKIRKGDAFVVAEDVITRGGRVQETIDIVEGHGGEVAAVAVLVDRSGGKARLRYPTFSLLKMEPVTYDPAQCPLCAGRVPISHPGS
jgi:orotate phosphoribosyltransferase